MFSQITTLLVQVFCAARAGQKLPILTIALMIHLPIHITILLDKDGHPMHRIIYISAVALVLNFILHIAGYSLLVVLYQHSVKNIFNREMPSNICDCLPSFGVHLALLRPLEIIFRYFTHSWRVLPDIIVLGEVRCGTTSLCNHISSLSKHSFDCQTPFCPWAHPELDHKETFFFVGHYLGFVTPTLYKMCFPLKINMLRNKLFRRLCLWWGGEAKPSFTFDGCAQYLTSPTAPYLISEAYLAAKQPPPILIACVRDTKDQAASWWKYESNAMAWGDSMGLKKFNTTLRTNHYPPKTINDALDFGNCKFVKDLYKDAEMLFSQDRLQDATRGCQSVRLPNSLLTWPGGQLSGIGNNARFVENISRYETVFQRSFGKAKGKDGTDQSYVQVLPLPLQHLNKKEELKDFLVDVMEKVAVRRGDESGDFSKAIETFASSTNSLDYIHRNATATSTTSNSPSSNDVMSKSTKEFFAKENQKFLSFRCQEKTLHQSRHVSKRDQDKKYS